MSFWDNVKKFAQPYGEEDYDDYDETMDEYEEDAQETAPRSSRRSSPFASVDTHETEPKAKPAPAVSTGFGSQTVNLGSGKQEVVLFHAKTLGDGAKAANELRNKKAVILNMENVDKALIRRVVDFLSGSVYALDGSVRKIAQATYLFCPHNMDVVGDLETIPTETENFF